MQSDTNVVMMVADCIDIPFERVRMLVAIPVTMLLCSVEPGSSGRIPGNSACLQVQHKCPSVFADREVECPFVVHSRR